MTKEEVRKELTEATKLQREATRVVNEALCHAAGQLDKAGAESFETGHKIGYEKGLNDCWETVRAIFEHIPAIRTEIFGVDPANLTQILTKFTPQQALEKMAEYEKKKAEKERKKQEQAEKIRIGDVVEVINKSTGNVLDLRALYLGNYKEIAYRIFSKSGDVCILSINNFLLRKTGEHVDILGVLK